MTKPTLNERIRGLCKNRGMIFKPWQATPWDCDDGPSPWPAGTVGAASWPQAQALRRKLIAEIRRGGTW
jgi:hypothetical protein